ncbi:MAG: glycosyltransferase family 9 protein [Candidatus Omnitrophica bacterium]|nr:glycosyltransferase family 9 protein [Candidatus Omnitrophota bacterium]
MSKKIVVIKYAAIGDVLRTTAILPALKEKYLDAKIYWITTDLSKPILENHPLIDKIYVESELTEEFKKSEYDLIINLDEDWDACQLASDLKGKRFGYYLKDGKILGTERTGYWMAMSLLGGEDRDLLKKKNQFSYQKIMCDIIDIPYSSKYKPMLKLTKQEEKDGLDFARQYRIDLDKDIVVGINTSAGRRWPLKEMPLDKTVKLIDKLIKEKFKVVLFGGEKECERNRIIRQQADRKLIDSGYHSSLRRFSSLINICDVVVSADTLAMHISIYLGKYTIAFFGPTPPQEIEFYSKGEAVSLHMDCLCCMKKVICDKKPNCMDLLDENCIVQKIIDYRKNNAK